MLNSQHKLWLSNAQKNPRKVARKRITFIGFETICLHLGSAEYRKSCGAYLRNQESDRVGVTNDSWAILEH